MNNLSILVVEDEEDLREIICFFLMSKFKADIDTACNGQEAIDKIKERNFDFIICDYNMPKKNGGDVYHFLANSNRSSKFVFCSSHSVSDFDCFTDPRALFGHIQKPNIIEGMNQIFAKLEAQELMAQRNNYHIYLPIKSKLLLFVSHLPADIYIKLSENKYIKVFEAGMIFDETDFLKYEKKGIDFFYALNISIDQFISGLQNAITKLHDNKTSEKVLNVSLQVHDILVNLFKSFGYRESLLPHIESQLEETLDMCQSNKTLSLLLRKMLKSKSNFIGKHSFMLSAVSIALASKMGWVSVGTSKKIVLASLFHDVFLKDSIHSESEILNGKNIENDFFTHPQLATDFLSEIPGVPPDTAKICLEQHEIGEEHGIPRAVAVSKVSPLGQLFSFAHECVEITIRNYQRGQSDKDSILKDIESISTRSVNCKKFFFALNEIDLFF